MGLRMEWSGARGAPAPALAVLVCFALPKTKCRRAAKRDGGCGRRKRGRRELCSWPGLAWSADPEGTVFSRCHGSAVGSGRRGNNNVFLSWKQVAVTHKAPGAPFSGVKRHCFHFVAI